MTDRTTTHDPLAGSPRGSSGGTGSEASDRERARRAADDIKTAARDAATSTTSAVRSRLAGELDYRKYRSRQRLTRVVSALRQTGSNLENEDETVARYADRAAERLERVAQYLDEKDVGAMMADARRMARRRPEIFVGSMFFAGLMLGRFLRSSTPEPNGRGFEGRSAYGGEAYAGPAGGVQVPSSGYGARTGGTGVSTPSSGGFTP